ncbi:DUF3870 domain-containing protein [Bacillus thermotolerans]|uniref:DUF3870 domain-containing protein n=1 Tax=Bacillus thermotolerans TaxID=1221996 RepID=A0A0F5I2P7_BACTR|nr:DUF3870 domain-containing protein [Bacillus thermotolerans]KKB38260.1 hypothetical protein QY97_02793 [Bacillus thermotolerans]KKB39806.1 hypothetical protein QY95_02023 [Bacillus thermotolerans]KKB44244.1 hypothetical protein QY96_03266 [Bacillus thermotolerans]
MVNSRVMFIAGHARLPQGMAAKSVFDTLTITAEVDVKYGVIIEASCTLATQHGREFIGNLLKGISLKDGIEEPLQALQQFYKGKAANALAAALNDLHLHYQQVAKKEEK